MDDLIQNFSEYAISIMDEQGIYPTPAIAKHVDGKLSIYAMAVDANQIISRALNNGYDAQITEQIFSLDTYTKEGQFTTLDSCLIMFHAVRGKPARIGVLEYSWNNGNPVSKPVNWDNPFWNETYKGIAEAITRAFQTHD